MSEAQITAAIIGAFAAFGYYITARIGKTGSREINLINELQEQLKAEQDARRTLSVRVDELFTKVNALMTRDVLWEIHSARVEAQVINLGGTPISRPMELQTFNLNVQPSEERTSQ